MNARNFPPIFRKGSAYSSSVGSGANARAVIISKTSFFVWQECVVCGLKSSRRVCIAMASFRLSFVIVLFRNVIFLLTLSTIVRFICGKQSLSGIAGQPPPEPMSSTLIWESEVR